MCSLLGSFGLEEPVVSAGFVWAVDSWDMFLFCGLGCCGGKSD